MCTLLWSIFAWWLLIITSFTKWRRNFDINQKRTQLQLSITCTFSINDCFNALIYCDLKTSTFSKTLLHEIGKNIIYEFARHQKRWWTKQLAPHIEQAVHFVIQPIYYINYYTNEFFKEQQDHIWFIGQIFHMSNGKCIDSWRKPNNTQYYWIIRLPILLSTT